jgi:hypothetical protein
VTKKKVDDIIKRITTNTVAKGQTKTPANAGHAQKKSPFNSYFEEKEGGDEINEVSPPSVLLASSARIPKSRLISRRSMESVGRK